MPFPDLVLKSDPRWGGGRTSTIVAEATGVPDNGANTFALPFVAAGIDPSMVDEDWFENFCVQANGPDVTGARFTSISGDKTMITMDFDQAGADSATVRIELKHSVVS
jgi:hypothetical protein